MPKNLKRAILLGSSAAGLITAMPAMAQDSPADIIVTARRVEERLQDVPISITVFNQAALTARNVVNAGDLATYTPSLAANGRFGAENTSFAIRGFVQDPGTPPSVAVYFADVAALRAAGGTTLGNGAGPGSFFDLSNVQVLKGTQGTLFGRNTTGGAVLIVPQKPTHKFEGYVEGSYGNYNMKRVQAVLNVPVMDTFRVRAGVDRQTRRGYLHNYSNIGPRDFSNIDYTAARVSAVADLSPTFENYTVATFSNSNTHGYLPQVFTCAPGTQTTAATIATANAGCAQISRQRATGDYYAVENATIAPRLRIQQWQFINTTTWAVNDDLTIKNIASYGEFREDFRSSVYGENLILPNGPNAGQSFKKLDTSPAPGRHSAAESTFTEELHFAGGGTESRLNWQAGVYTEISDPIGFSGYSSVSSGLCPTANNFGCIQNGSTLGGTGLVNERLNRQQFRDYGVFGQATYKLTDKFSVTGGIRYTWDSTTAVTQQSIYIYPSLVPAATLNRTCITGNLANSCEAAFHISSKAPTWLIDVDYKPNEDILLYAKYARGYRAAGLKIDGGAVFNTFTPEKVDTYEAGFKTSWRGALRGTFNASVFYSKFLSEQLNARLDPTPINPNTTPPSVIASDARSRIYGVEIEGSIQPFKGLSIDGAYAYLNTRLLSVAPVSGASTLFFPPVTTNTTPGSSLGYAPRHKFTVSGNYTLPLDADVGKVTVGMTYSYTGSQLTSASYIIPVSVQNPTIPASLVGNLGRIKAYSLVNANLSWTSVAGTPIDLGFFATNLFKEKYVAAVFGGIGAFGYDSRALGEPRTYGVRLKYHFGG